MKNKLKIVVLGIFCILLLTGCGASNNNSSENVAQEMANRLSSGNYKNISDLLGDEYLSISESQFANFINDRNLNIKGNKKIKLVKDSLNEKIVKFEIDNNKILEITTKEVNGKWYVDLDDYVDKNLVINVPTGSIVKIDGKDIKDQKTETNKIDSKKASLSYSYNFTYEVGIDVYNISTLFPGEYALEVTHDKAVTYKGSIKSKTNNFSGTDKNITVDKSNNAYSISLSIDQKEKEAIQTFYKEYYQKLLDTVNARGDIAALNEYLDTNNSTFVASFNTLKEKVNRDGASNWSYTYTDMKLTTVELEDGLGGIIYIGGDRYALFTTTNFNYVYSSLNSRFPNMNKTETKSAAVKTFVELKKENGKYKIIGGNPIFQIS